MNLRTATEAELRDYKAPWPRSLWQLAKIVLPLLHRQHEYGTCVYAMSISAHAMFLYVSTKLGVTGFQASCADMDFITRSRGWKRFRLVNYDELLYPQYRDKFDEIRWESLLKENKDWLRESANEMLMKGEKVHPEVKRHWERLASAA